jgi:hypothetical protein
MLDDESGESLNMQVVAEIEYDDKTYALLIPADTLVLVLAEDSDDELSEVEPEEFDSIQKHVNDALAQWGLSVERRANEVILGGEEPDDLYEDCDVFSTGDDDEDEYFIITEVSTGDTNYLISVKAMPNLFPVELVDEENARTLGDEEMGRMHEVFQEAIQVLNEEEA